MKNNRGVSPVIAVVLLVSITVVLAATAYLMVINMTEGLTSKPPYMGLTDVGLVGDGKRKIEVAHVEYNNPIEKYGLSLLINGTIDENSKMELLFNGTMGNVTFGDIDGRFNSGDFFLVDVIPNTEYTIKIFWKPTGDQAGTEVWKEAP